ncbi:GNAT family N-acetyltransferase [Conyzicola nivalis]|uniref:GNAT family N-acetyltransferase n=1 Tax=Conyzicola nivalis TaxID=1477021 RepID=A0A916WIL3_9MICO|nr:GNAT family N-acetyltransferase [Conyzicola nivalis]GGB01222.1 GNAT family N-acetyltransferase [Conyzicola nivalis]
MTPTFTVEELVVPQTIDSPDAADFVETIELRNLVEALAYGTHELEMTAVETLPFWLDPENSPRRLFGVRIDGRLVGRGFYETNVGKEGSDAVAWGAVEVLPDFRGRGIGTAIAEFIERVARDEGRDRLLVYVASPDGPGERLDAATGFGSVPRDNGEVRFLLGRGYRLEQIERASRLPLPLDDGELRAAFAGASAASGADYSVHYWTGATPERWLDDLALLYTRMSTDAPSAGLEEPEDVWTATRVSADDERQAASPRTSLTAAVEHVPTGRLVGFTVLSLPSDTARSVGQYDTLVLREHRGHRLGMLLKVANLAALHQHHPGYPSVITFNAEENRHMLQVNEDLGFVPIGYEGAWRKRLS